QADRVDCQRVALPLRHGVSHESRFDVRWMGLSDWYDPKKVHVLIKDHYRIRSLDDLLGVRSERFTRVAVRQAKRGRIVVAKVSCRTLKEKRLGARLEWRHLAPIEVGHSRRIRIVRTD